MNTAVHDAYDLAWKLDWVLRGWAHPDLLDSYEEERRPVGIRNTVNSAQTGRDPSTAFAEHLGGRLPHVWQRYRGRTVPCCPGPTAESWRGGRGGMPEPTASCGTRSAR